jgi:hypothetical protein
MAPAAIETFSQTPSVFSYDNPSKLIFPDGIKTSGQFDPEYDQVKPYEEFPDEITGPTVWKAEEYAKNPEQWTHYFSKEEVQEMSDAADAFIASTTPLTGITKVI